MPETRKRRVIFRQALTPQHCVYAQVLSARRGLGGQVYLPLGPFLLLGAFAAIALLPCRFPFLMSLSRFWCPLSGPSGTQKWDGLRGDTAGPLGEPLITGVRGDTWSRNLQLVKFPISDSPSLSGEEAECE
jgi:hypothetical protein